MSRMDEPTDPAFIAEVAHMVIDSHDRGHRCQRCTDSGCDQPDWARGMLRDVAEHLARRALAQGKWRPSPVN